MTSGYPVNYSSSGRGSCVPIEERCYLGPKKSYTLTASGFSKRSVTCVIDYKDLPSVSPAVDEKIRKNLEIHKNNKIRKLTPIEYERIQGLPDNYTSVVSNTQRYKMIGNGWQVDAVAEFFKNLESD